MSATRRLLSSRHALALSLLALAGGVIAQPDKAASAPSAKQLAALCAECSWVGEVHSYEHKGEGSALGVIGGAVVGGLLGHQVGGGTGKKIATVGGAVAGGYAGNEIEKRSKSYRVWSVRLIAKDGSHRTHEQRSDPQLRSGDVVVLKDGRLERR